MIIDLYHLYLHQNHVRLMPPPILDVIRAWTEPLGHAINLRISTENRVKYDTPARVVAISVYTQTAPAAYRIAARFRKMGKIVILGGPHFHADFTATEAADKCDIVARSICREQWEDLLARIESGRISPGQIKAETVIDKDGRFTFPENLYRVFAKKKPWQFTLIPASLGCPYRCEFCNPYMPGTYINRDTETVWNEVRHVKSPVVGLCDATFGLNKSHAMKLMRRIAPLKKQLWIETTLSRLRDEEFLDALAQGGVKWIAVGIESLSGPLKKHGAGSEEDIRSVFIEVNRRGMLVQGNFICGMDRDGPDSFGMIHDFCSGPGVNFAYIDIMVPFPTTALFNRYIDEGKIIDMNWDHYDFYHLVYMPSGMTAQQLVDGYIRLYRSITSMLFLMKKAVQILRTAGFKIGAMLMIAYSIFTVFDARRKERFFRKSLAALSVKGNIKGLPN